MISAMEGTGSGKGKSEARVEVQDLMTKLMSGDTLSTEELMQLQKFDWYQKSNTNLVNQNTGLSYD